MKKTFKVFGVLLGVVVLYGVLIVALSELGGEVATLARPESDGSTKNIRVWIVDSDNISWIEHGTDESYWIKQSSDGVEVSVIRDEKEEKYKALTDSESHDFYHNLRREKYAFADKMLDVLSFGATSKENCSGVPVKLVLK
tara:strand:- start:32 stop:454 length:423 start_codon:yes stop_codon:yes gene_type:complete